MQLYTTRASKLEKHEGLLIPTKAKLIKQEMNCGCAPFGQKYY